MQKTNLIITILIIGILVFGGYHVFTNSNGEEITTPSVSPSPSEQGSVTTQLNLFNNQTSELQAQPAQQMSQKFKQYQQFPGVLSSVELKDKKAVIKTTKGTIEFEIYPEASKAASNFIFLAKDGFYDSLTFHRVEPGFVIQGGDPQGDGRGGPGYKFEDESVTRSYDKGIVAMANAGPNTNGSQFFIMLEDNPSLPKNYTIFGKVTSGQDVVGKIQKGDVMQKVNIEPLK